MFLTLSPKGPRLRDAKGAVLNILSITDNKYPGKSHEAKAIFGADDIAHPAVIYLHNYAGGYLIPAVEAPEI